MCNNRLKNENNQKKKNSSSLMFPRWDIISVIFSVFLLTYTYQEGKSNYFKGSILILSYVVLVAGFYYIPSADSGVSHAASITSI